jgi:hypothetical protein
MLIALHDLYLLVCGRGWCDWMLPVQVRATEPEDVGIDLPYSIAVFIDQPFAA